MLELIRNNIKFSVPTISTEGVYIKEELWHLLIRNISRKIPTLLFGETGTAKTTIALFLAQKMGLPYHVVDMGGIPDAAEKFIGQTHLRTINGTVNTVFKESELFKFATTNPNGIIIFEELTRSTAATNNFIFPMADFRRSLNNKALADGISIIGTANIGSAYTGTNVLDKALRDRFFMVEITTPDKFAEIELIATKTGVTNLQAVHMVEIAEKIRLNYENGNIGTGVSTRKLLETATLVKDGWGLKEALLLCLLSEYQGGDEDSDRDKVKQILMAL